MRDIRPRAVTHRGNVHASGFIIGFDPVRPERAQRRVLTAWQTDARVYRLETALVLVLPEPVLVSVETAIGCLSSGRKEFLPARRCRRTKWRAFPVRLHRYGPRFELPGYLLPIALMPA